MTFEKIDMRFLALTLLRLSLGWLFFYAGITKVINPAWSAAGYLNTAKTFPELYHWFASPGILPVTNFLNEWGLTLVGISLLLGVFVRWGAYAGALLMILYYFPILQFPYPSASAFIVDQHIIFIAIFLYLTTLSPESIRGVEYWFRNKYLLSAK